MLQLSFIRRIVITTKMFKRYHDKQAVNTTKPQLNLTYQQINKSKSTLKSNYSNRYRHKISKHESLISPNIEFIKTDSFIFQGFVKNQQKQGEGVMMLKNGTIIFGTWIQDLLDGKALIFTSLGSKIYANFNLGKLSGWAVAIYGEKIIKCLFFYENHIDGEKLTYDQSQNLWVASKCTYDGKLISITHVEKGSRSELPSFLHSEDLRQLINRYIINRQKYIEFECIEQMEITISTSYIGFVDQQRRPSGMGAIYTNVEIYCGNFFEGALEHYGRILFSNGEIYHGQMIGGMFWGKGMYYSPSKNMTDILMTDEYQQHIESQFSGYVLINIVPNIGGYSTNNSNGIKGDTLNSIIQSLEPYYKKQFAPIKTKKKKVLHQSDNNSEYGKSEDMSGQVKAPAKQSKDKELPPLSIINQLKVNKQNPPEKWLKFNEEEKTSKIQELRRSQSLDKRQAATLRKNGNFEVKIKGSQANEYESIPIRQNITQQEAEYFMKQSPPPTKLMQQISFNNQGFQINRQPMSLDLGQLNTRMQSIQSASDKKRKEIEMLEKANEKEMSDTSNISNGTQKLNNIFDKSKNYRKKIFY